jgi:Mn2+/Fe2+ NRAMP family transporter
MDKSVLFTHWYLTLYEIFLVDVDWGAAGVAWIKPSIPEGSVLLIMSVLGAVVMPHNLFLHSEIIQSRQWNIQDDKVIRKQLKFEFADTLLSMIIGWAINSAIIILAAATFFTNDIKVVELQQAESLLKPLLGSNASVVFALPSFFQRIDLLDHLSHGWGDQFFRIFSGNQMIFMTAMFAESGGVLSPLLVPWL